MDDRAATAASNIPEYTVSEISGAVKRTLEGNFGRVRVRGEITELKRYPSGHIYFSLKDEGAKISGIVWKSGVPRLGLRAGERRRGDRHRPHLLLRRALVVSADRRADGICRRRRAAGADRGAAGEAGGGRTVRRRAQAARCRCCRAVIGVVTARAGRGDPGHPHHHRAPFPAPHPALAGAGAGRGRGRAHRRRHRRVFGAAGGRADPAPGRADRRARRRQPGRPDGLQRGDRGARRRRLHAFR